MTLVVVPVAAAWDRRWQTAAAAAAVRGRRALDEQTGCAVTGAEKDALCDWFAPMVGGYGRRRRAPWRDSRAARTRRRASPSSRAARRRSAAPGLHDGDRHGAGRLHAEGRPCRWGRRRIAAVVGRLASRQCDAPDAAQSGTGWRCDATARPAGGRAHPQAACGATCAPFPCLLRRRALGASRAVRCSIFRRTTRGVFGSGRRDVALVHAQRATIIAGQDSDARR